MPEGDTIYRIARQLDGRMRRDEIRACESREPLLGASLLGRTVKGVESRGKHLLIELSGELWLHSHLGMTGAWHLYRPSDRWFKPRSLAALALQTEGSVAASVLRRMSSGS